MKQKLIILGVLLSLCAVTAEAQVIDTLLNKQSTQPFSISLAVPDGNYLVTVTLGSKKKVGQTVVRAESRRHYSDLIVTKKGKFQTVTFVVNNQDRKSVV